MIQGTATITSGTPVTAPATEPLELPGATVLQVIYEFSPDDRDALFPPALHPVSPPCIAWSFLHAPVSVHGAFTLAETRLICRSGMRTRGLHVGGWIDNRALAEVLAAQWGYALEVADVTLDRRYDGTTGRVNGVLEVGHVAPIQISAGDLQYTASMHPVELDRGIRLLQVERAYTFHQAERGEPFARGVDATHPVSASSATADVTLKPVRFCCRPDVWAFEGTEPL